MCLIQEKKVLSGADVRFLRHELDLSQKMLGTLLDKSGQAVARWEKGKSKLDGSADRLLRLLYENHATEPGHENRIRETLEKLAELDSSDLGKVHFEDTDQGWNRAA